MPFKIDLTQIADELDFDLEDVEMLVEVFLEDAKLSLVHLKAAISTNNYESIFKFAHAIKGSASNLTLKKISKIALEMEIASRQEQQIDYLLLFDELQADIDALLNQGAT